MTALSTVPARSIFTTPIYNSYGIAIFVKYNHKTLDYISDVDVSRQRAKKIAALLNRFAVHPHDVRDVIEDIRDDPHF